MAIILNFDGKRNWTYGDSNLYGVAADPLSLRWSTLLASEKNGEDYNNGVSGQGWLNPGNLFVKEQIVQYDASTCKYIWFANGTNDLPLDPTTYSTAVFKAKLLEIVDYAKNTKGWAYSSMVLPTINVRTDINYGQRHLDFNEAIRQIAALRGCIYIDIYTIFNALPNKSSLIINDGLHYNNAGHRAIADIYKAADYSVYGNVTSTLKHVGTRCKYPSSYQIIPSGQTSKTMFSKHEICATITTLQLKWVGYYIHHPNNFADTVNPNDVIIKGGVEYNGVTYPFTFNNAATGTLTAGGQIATDELSVSIPKGSFVTLKMHYTVPSGGVLNGCIYLDPAKGEGSTAYGVDSSNVAVASASLSATWGFVPIGILGQTTENIKAVSVIGDSIFAGRNDDIQEGFIEKQLNALHIPYVNYAVPGWSATMFKTPANRAGVTKALQFNPTTHAILNIGGANDLLGSATAQSVYDDTLLVDASIRSYGIATIAHSTITPLGVSTNNNWGAPSGQTMRGQNAFRPSYHALLRGNSQITVLETAGISSVDVNGTPQNDGLYWKTGLTEDGVHPTPTGHLLMGGNNTLRTGILSFIGATTPGVTVNSITGWKAISFVFGGGTPSTPFAPTVSADDNNDILTASHPLGTSEIIMSINNASYIAYTPIAVGNTTRAAGYWKFKIKANVAQNRNESAVTNSPAFTVSTPGNTTPAAPTAPITEDNANTFGFTLTPSIALSGNYEKTLDGGTTITDVSTNPIQIGDVAKGIGQIGVRVKAASGRNASNWLFNTVAFTVTEVPVNTGLVAGNSKIVSSLFSDTQGDRYSSSTTAPGDLYNTDLRILNEGIYGYTFDELSTGYQPDVLFSQNPNPYDGNGYGFYLGNTNSFVSRIYFIGSNLTETEGSEAVVNNVFYGIRKTNTGNVQIVKSIDFVNYIVLHDYNVTDAGQYIHFFHFASTRVKDFQGLGITKV